VSFLAELLLVAWVLLSIFVIGIAITHRFLRMRGLDLIAYGAAAGVLLHGLFGLWIAMVARYHGHITTLLGVLAIVSLIYLLRQKVIVDLVRELMWPIKILLGTWILFVIFCIGITHVEVRWPATLPNGQFIFKTHTTNVKIQFLADAPTDNSIPYIVQEFFLRHISFQKERPILFPHSEVAERTVLMSLVGVPFRTVIDPQPRYQEPLPRINYEGQDIPNVETLYSEKGFRQFLIISIALNSLLLLGIGLFCANLGITTMLPVAAVLFASTPYFIEHTIYSWPKALAAFFVILAWDSFRRVRDVKLVASCSALAYHCHPYALAFLGGMGLCCLRGHNKKIKWRDAVSFGVIAAAFLLPWFIWSRPFHVPSMFTWHFYSDGVHAVFPNRIWVRVLNLFGVLVPTFPLVYPFDAIKVARTFTMNLPAAAGLIFFLPGLVRLFRLSDKILLYGGMIFPATIIIFVFGRPEVPTAHGLQPLAAALLFLGIAQMRERLKASAFWTLIAIQLILNLSLIVAIGYSVGAHFF
jgi:hypothetical protein